MTIINVKVEQTRPLDATPERALTMIENGIKNKEIAAIWGVSPSRVSALVKKGRELRAKEGKAHAE